MQLPVMPTTERYGELIADFQANAAQLGESQMMRIARLPTANQARLRCNEFQMSLITQPLGLGNGELAFVNRAWSRIEAVRDKRWSHRGLFSVGRIFSQLVCH